MSGRAPISPKELHHGSAGFQRFGWGPPLLDDEASAFISQTFQRADAFLLGRRTYEIFAGSSVR